MLELASQFLLAPGRCPKKPSLFCRCGGALAAVGRHTTQYASVAIPAGAIPNWISARDCTREERILWLRPRCLAD